MKQHLHRAKQVLTSRAGNAMALARASGRWLKRAGAILQSNLGALIAGSIAFLGLLLAANQLEDGSVMAERSSISEAYFYLLDHLGNSDEVVRNGAIRAIPQLMTTPAPVRERGGLFRGMGRLIGWHDHPVEFPFHEDLQLTLSTLLSDSISGRVHGGSSVAAVLQVLCKLGPSGWYSGQLDSLSRPREECLQWIWNDAPPARLSNSPSSVLFEGAVLSDQDLRGQRLRRANFRHAIMARVRLDESLLDSANFAGSRLEGVSFKGASLSDARFDGAQSTTTIDFSGATLTGATFNGANFCGHVLLSNVIGVEADSLGTKLARTCRASPALATER